MSIKKNRFTTTIKKEGDDSLDGSGFSFVILSAGRGRSSRNYENKSLIQHKGATLVRHQINTIRSKYGDKSDIILVTGYDSENVIKRVSGVRIVENPHFDTTDVVESMRIGINACCSSSIFFIHGDMIFSPSFISIPDVNHIWLPIDVHKRLSKTSLGITSYDDVGTYMSYGLPNKWCQISYFPSSKFKWLKTELSKTNKTEPCFGFFNKIMDETKVKTFEPDLRGFIKEINSSKDLK